MAIQKKHGKGRLGTTSATPPTISILPTDFKQTNGINSPKKKVTVPEPLLS
jgi:hypothetical protein